MSARTDVLLWAQRIVGRASATCYQILELAPGCDGEAAQAAFHKIARMAHPDLHRGALTPEELELVTTAYARAAAAYQEVRTLRARQARKDQETSPAPNIPRPMTPTPGTAARPATPTPSRTAPKPTPGPPEPDLSPAQAMSSKALVYYRKAELCLRRGDLTSAVLQLKMAIAADPQSKLLRNALAEVMTEVGKKP